MSITIAVCQFTAGLDVAENTSACVDLIAEAAAAGADLAVLPEASMFFDPARTQIGQTHGEPIDGEFAQAMADAAKASGIAVVAGMSEQIDDRGRDSNTLIALGPTGERIGLYRKIHLYDAFGFRESETIAPGQIDAPTLIEVNGLRVGLLTCYDLRFPEVFRWVAEAGAEVIVLPAAWAVGPAKEDHWRTLIKARAIENTIYLAAAGQTGPSCCGQSLIVDPMGVELAGAGLEPGIAVATVTRQRIDRVRRINPSLTNRRFTVAPA